MADDLKVMVASTNGSLNFKGTNSRSQSIILSGNQEAVSPMESVLIAAATCSSIDIEMILKKMRQDIQNIDVTVTGKRADSIPAVFTDIHLHYKVSGDIRREKLDKAITMSMEQYCSVSIMLSKAVMITWSSEIIKPI
jgi:putative redox protein